jgi:hypothetical protein
LPSRPIGPRPSGVPVEVFAPSVIVGSAPFELPPDPAE